ncbi:Hypothetical predicted protein [Octopus vulgaris]|uniref:Uncharacterized protein n=1 Tax=Octopus vulgaris TaxID=6645 RepID=A0AA36B224_OCTVU|nr:Hypothetical predicted protein [Octopus vulgaris]
MVLLRNHKQQKAHYSASSKSFHYCKTPGHLIADCRKLKAKEEAAEASQSRDRAVPEAAFKGFDLSNVVGSVEIMLDPDEGVSDAVDVYLVMTPVVDSSRVDASSDSSSTPESVTLFRETDAEQTLLKRDAVTISMLTSLGKEVVPFFCIKFTWIVNME